MQITAHQVRVGRRSQVLFRRDLGLADRDRFRAAGVKGAGERRSALSFEDVKLFLVSLDFRSTVNYKVRWVKICIIIHKHKCRF